MYDVTQDYLDALTQTVRTDTISGTLTLADGDEKEITDEVLVSGTLKLTKELCGDRYAIGTFNLSCLKFSFFIDSALGLDLTGASVTMDYKLRLGDGTYETVPLGEFLIDPVLSVRRKNVLSIVAYDKGVLADREPSDTIRNMNCTPAELIIAVCAECGIQTDIEADSLAGFPNSAVTVTAKDKQIQSCRDIVMWCAALVCGYAVIDRGGKLCIIPAKYASDGSTITTDRTVTADERQSIRVTDTRAYIKYLTAYAGDKVVNYTSSYVSQDEQAAPAAYVLERNPLLADKTETGCMAANIAWLTHIDGFKQRGVNAVIYGDPAIDTGDTLVFRGGDVDQRDGVVGVVTSYEWRYRDSQTVVCSAAECVGSLVNGGAFPASSSRTRSQTDKRIDGIDTGAESGGGVGEWLDPDHTTERFNDYNGNTSDNKYDHIEGYGNIVQSESNFAAYGANHVEGMSNKVYGTSHNSYIGGFGNTFGVSTNMSTGVDMCMIHGNCNTLKSGSDSYVSGSQCTIDYASMSMIIGDSLTLKYVVGSVVSGQYISATSDWAQIQNSIIGGGRHSITNEVYCSIWGGLNNTGRANCGLAVGEDNEVNAIRSMTCGRGNKNTQSDSIMCGYYGTNGDWDYYRIAVGGGSGTSDRRNIFGVDINGDVYGRSYNTMGADYAEYFEWADGNPENEDRCGMLVMLDGDRIVPAHGDDILGAVSAAPSVIGNSADLYWQGTYATDIYGRPVTNGKGERMLSSAYDPGLKYIPRSKRKEWDAVGLVGRLVIRDNGSCTVGGYCTADRGIANPANNKTNVRVLKRINDTHIEVLIK